MLHGARGKCNNNGVICAPDVQSCVLVLSRVDSLGDWGSWVQIPPLRPIKSIAYQKISQSPRSRSCPLVAKLGKPVGRTFGVLASNRPRAKVSFAPGPSCFRRHALFVATTDYFFLMELFANPGAMGGPHCLNPNAVDWRPSISSETDCLCCEWLTLIVEDARHLERFAIRMTHILHDEDSSDTPVG